MQELIDREWLRKRIAELSTSFLSEWDTAGVLSLVESAPAVDPVIHAHWIEEEDCQICSNCGEEHCWDEYRASYCDTCGAKMDGETEGQA